MSKRYACRKCKEGFEGRLDLTRHLRSCGRRPRKEGTPICPECGKKCANWGALGAHRAGAHKVAGASRWSIKQRKRKSSQAPQRHVVLAPNGNGAKENEVVARVRERIEWHKAEAGRHLDEARKLEQTIPTLQGAF